MPIRAPRLLAPAALLLALGCGLANYEENIDRQHKRIKLFDEESRILGDIIVNPAKKEDEKTVPAWPFEVFLRLPRKVGAAPAAVHQGTGARLPVYQYAGPDGSGLNVFVAAGAVTDKNKEREYRANEWPAEDFKAELALGLKAYYRVTYKVILDIRPGLPFTMEKRQPMSPQGTPLLPLNFEVAAITDEGANQAVADQPSTFLLFYHQNIGRQVGVIYQLPKRQLDAKDDATLKLLDYSIRSLDVISAALKRQEFQKAKAAS